jgi:hypothetical protein
MKRCICVGDSYVKAVHLFIVIFQPSLLTL